jgi:hypothetical protein
VDIDDYINSLIKENEHLKNVVHSLKNEVKIQRQEIAGLRAERKILFDNDRISEYTDASDPRLQALQKLSDLDQELGLA